LAQGGKRIVLQTIKEFFKATPRWVEVVSFIVLIVSVTIGMNAYFVKAEDFKKLELRVEQKIVSDRADQLEQRAWKLEDRYQTVDKMPPEIKTEYRKIMQEKLYLRESLNKLSACLIEKNFDMKTK